MASNFSPRSNSSASQSRSQRTSRPATVKGRPSQGRSPRLSAMSSQRAYGSRSVGSARSSARSGYGSRSGDRGSRAAVGSSRSSREPELRSVTVSQVRDEQRYRSRRASHRATNILIVVAVAVVALVVAAVVLANSGVFKVENITVSGVEHITSEELTEATSIPEGATLLNVDASGVTERLLENPWVQSVDVQRVFPNTLNLAITERSISAVVNITVDNTSKTTERWALSADGMWLTKIPDQDSEEGKQLATKIYEDADAALEITDIPYSATPEAGQYCNNANVENALGIIDGMTTELADQVKTVSAAGGDSTTLTLESGVEIAFGDSSDIRDKERVCLQLLEEYPNQISYINVRVVNKPVWRSL